MLEAGAMRLDPEKERRIVAHMKGAELYASAPPADGLTFRPAVDYPPHGRRVEIEILGKKFHVPEKNSLLRCFHFISP